MDTVTLRRIRLADAGSAAGLAALRDQLGAQGNVVSARGRELTQKVFGEPLPPARVVERVCADVKSRGLAALLHYTEQFDRARLAPDDLRVGADELAAARAKADPAFVETVRRVRQNVLSFQLGLLHRDA